MIMITRVMVLSEVTQNEKKASNHLFSSYSDLLEAQNTIRRQLSQKERRSNNVILQFFYILKESRIK